LCLDGILPVQHISLDDFPRQNLGDFFGWNPRTLAMSSSLETLRQILIRVLSTSLRKKG